MLRLVILTVCAMLFASSVDAKGWVASYGGLRDDYLDGAHPTADGGHIAVGYTRSSSGGAEAWVLKLDADGKIVWQKTYGGSGDDSLRAVQPTSDGGYVIAGGTALGA